MYCLSSEETLKAFLLNPRPYLLPPMPAPPFKVFVFGPPSSGKTTLCNLLAEHYNGKVTTRWLAFYLFKLDYNL